MAFDLKDIYHKDRPMSWSAISSFEWNPNQWYRKYVLKELPEITPELEFGSYIDKRVQNEPDFLPGLVRYPVIQHEMRCVFNGIPLLGFSDTARLPTKKAKTRVPVAVRDYKTGRKPWTQKRADETGQLTLYTFMLYMMDKIKPEDIELYIDWMPTHYVDGKIAFIKEGDIHTFQTRRTMQQCLAFGQRIKDTWDAMQEYGERQAALEEGLSADEFFSK